MDDATNDQTAALKTGLADMQHLMRSFQEKGTSSFGEMNDLAKGNVRAMMESSKILAAGLQDIGRTLVAESRTMFESLSTDAKELAAVKSPTDYMRLQSEMFGKMYGWSVSYGMKHAEAMRKLVTDSAAPLSERVNVAVEKAKPTT